MVKRRVKLTYGSMKRVWKTVKCQGKIREKSGNFEVEDTWQPWKKGRKAGQYTSTPKIGTDECAQ